MVNCAMMHGLAILLPESTLVQSPLRLSACAHMHIHAYLELECEQALTHGSRPPEARAVTAGGHGISTAAGHIVERLPHGELVQTRISKCGGSSDDIALTSSTRGCCQMAPAFICCAVFRVTAPAGFSSLNAKDRDSLPRGGRARSGACMHSMWHVLDLHG